MTVSRLFLALLASSLCVGTTPRVTTAPQPALGSTLPPGQPPTRQQTNDEFVRKLTASISGREGEPAERVFKNIRLELFKDIRAGDLLDIMDGGYSRALGVTCTHCHVETDFSSDEKRPKRAAREMAAMHRGINQQLARMAHLESEPEDRFINCGTCHRGRLHPQQRP